MRVLCDHFVDELRLDRHDHHVELFVAQFAGIGNEARGSDPGPSAEVKAVIEERLKALGL